MFCLKRQGMSTPGKMESMSALKTLLHVQLEFAVCPHDNFLYA